MPITSYGVVAYRQHPETGKYEYLLIQRKDTLGFIDFMQGKYSIHNKQYLLNMLKQMTVQEKHRLLNSTFEDLWTGLWGSQTSISQYRIEESISREKFLHLKTGILVNSDFYDLAQLAKESDEYGRWTDAEWGFPKGRRNYLEKDYDCALREFAEETGYSTKKMINIQNISPLDEIFTGSNYKSYKHRYFLMYMNYADSLESTKIQLSEVSNMEWMSLDVCLSKIRPYNTEKREVVSKIERMLCALQPIYNL